MPVKYRIIPSTHILYYAGFGHFTSEEGMLAERTSRQDPLREPSMAIIVDGREISELDVSVDGIRRAIAMNRERVAQSEVLEPTAILLGKPFHKLVVNTYARLAEHFVELKMEAFFELPEALEWLGIPQHEQVVLDARNALQAEYVRSLS